MSITREQVADLRAGDVVELTHEDWPTGTVVRGPLWLVDGETLQVGRAVVRHWDGRHPFDTGLTLTLISRAKPPLYVNHPRTEPVPGDVVRGTQIPGVEPGTWTYTFNGWVSTRSGSPLCLPPCPARLLVDGRTGQVVSDTHGTDGQR